MEKAQTIGGDDLITELFGPPQTSKSWMPSHEHVTPVMMCAVARDSIATGERLGYVAGLAENAGTWNVAMTFDGAVAEAYRLNALDDGCQYWAVCYKGEES